MRVREREGEGGREREGADKRGGGQLLDSKLTDDTRKLLNAVQALNTAHEALKASTDEHFAQVLAEQERNLTRVWTDIEANRAHADKHLEEVRARLGEEEHARKEEDAAVRGLLDTLQHDMQHKTKMLDDELRHEAATRAAADLQLREAADAEREQTQAADHELDLRITRLDDKTAGELAEVRKAAVDAAEASAARSSKNRDEIEAVKMSVERLDEDYLGSKALLQDLQEASVRNATHIQGELDTAARAVKAEEAARQAAVTEVYRRMLVAREMDAMVNNAAEAALLERIAQVRAHVEQTGQAAESGMDQRVQRLSALIRDLERQDEHLKLKIDDVEKSAEKAHAALQAQDELMKKEVDDTKATAVLKASQMQDEVRAMGELVAREVKGVQGQVTADLATLKADMASEREARDKAVADKGAEWAEALQKEKQEREDQMQKERAEQAAAVEAEKSERKAVADSISQRVDELEAKEQKLEEGAEKAGTDAAEKLRALEEKHAELEATVAGNKAALEEKIDGGSTRVAEEVSAKVEQMGSQVAVLADRVGKLDDSVEEVGGKLSGIEGSIAQLGESVKGLEEDKADKVKLEAELQEVSLLREKFEKVEGSYVSKERLEEALAESSALLDSEVKPKMEELRQKLEEVAGAGVSDEAVAALECFKQLEGKVEGKAEVAVADETKQAVLDLQTRLAPLEQFVAAQDASAAEGADKDSATAGEDKLSELKASLQKEAEEAQKNADFRFDNFKITQDTLTQKLKDLDSTTQELKDFGNLNARNIVELEQRLDEKVANMDKKVVELAEAVSLLAED